MTNNINEIIEAKRSLQSSTDEVKNQLLKVNIANGLRLGQFSFENDEIVFKRSETIFAPTKCMENIAGQIISFSKDCNTLIKDGAKYLLQQVKYSTKEHGEQSEYSLSHSIAYRKQYGNYDDIVESKNRGGDGKHVVYDDYSLKCSISTISVSINQANLKKLAEAGVEMPSGISELLGVKEKFADKVRP